MKERIAGWIYRIAEDHGGNIWLGGEEGLWCYLRSMDSLYCIRKIESRTQRITAIYPDSSGNIWVASQDSLIEQYNNLQLVRRFEHGHGFARSMVEDGTKRIYLGTTNGLLFFYGDSAHGELVQYLSTENGLHDNDLTRLLLDREHNLWIAGNGNGLAKLSEQNLFSFSLKGSPTDYDMSRIIIDNEQHYWISSENGVWEFWRSASEKSNYYFHPIEGMKPGTFAIPGAIDKKGNLWVSLTSGEVELFEIRRSPLKESTMKRKKKFFCAFSEKEHTSALPYAVTVILDKRGRLWYAVSEIGVFCVSVDDSIQCIKKFTVEDGLPDKTVWTLFEDVDGNIWAGGVAKGLSKITWNESKLVIQKYSTEDGLGDGAIRGITQDKDGRIWIGLRYAGLAVFEHGKFTTYTKNNGLMSNLIWCVACDDQNRLWIGTQTGVQFLRVNELPAFHLKNIASGFRSNVCSVSKSDFIVINTPHGIALYDPSKENEMIPPPLIHVDRFFVNTVEIGLRGNLIFPYNQNNIKIDFTGISFRSENKIKYRYRLLPGEKGWLAPTYERSVSYRYLTPGTYTFNILAISSEGVESAEMDVITFTILEPYWMTWWFRGTVAGGIFGILYIFYRHRMQKAIEIERLRMRLASDLHDEIATNLSSIAMFSRIIQDESYKGPEKKQLIERISVLSSQSVDAIRDIIWAIDPRTETLHDLLIRVQDFIALASNAKMIYFHIEIPEKGNLPGGNLPPEIRKNLWLLLKEAAMNSIKHSEGKDLWFRCRQIEKNIIFEIEDNGRGFDALNRNGGKGLYTMKNRCESLGGAFNITSELQRGTKITVTLDL